MLEIRQEDHELLEPGMIVQIAPKLMGSELYGGSDPEELKKWCGQCVTVSEVKRHSQWMVYVEEVRDGNSFYMEEIECIVDNTEISESDEPISALLGGIA